ncbi:hypothetical protein N8290_05165, partial [Pseudomonadales bacterium]|nr:hypothetical protein [Pseudomonadales bacterium]
KAIGTVDIATPDVATPDIATPDIATPDVATRDPAIAETAKRDVNNVSGNVRFKDGIMIFSRRGCVRRLRLVPQLNVDDNTAAEQ